MKTIKNIFIVIVTILFLSILYIRHNGLVMKVDGIGMEPIISNESYIFINKFSSYKEGDIVLLKEHNELSPEGPWIARISKVNQSSIDVEVSGKDHNFHKYGELPKDSIIGIVYPLNN